MNISVNNMGMQLSPQDILILITLDEPIVLETVVSYGNSNKNFEDLHNIFLLPTWLCWVLGGPTGSVNCVCELRVSACGVSVL